ncbi:PAM68 family protein [Geminocystis sp. CENA526]|uniref:PAM68 family protein n=1 Tax=Geminocystis sp. CENA526 TaxID=1355871 RepID=UPI003D6E8176
MPSPSNRNSLPFEPKKNKKVVKKTTNNTPVTKSEKTSNQNFRSNKQKASLREIPEVVSKRMIRRMAIFSGIPTGLGILSFFAFYLVVKQEWFKVPNTAVLLVSMGLFGLGVLGLSYGILSTSWDEERVGTWWGWSDFSLNFSRMTSAWRSARQESINNK